MDIDQISLDTARLIANIDPDRLVGGKTQALAAAQCLIRDALVDLSNERDSAQRIADSRGRQRDELLERYHALANDRDALAAHVELLSREGDILAQGLHPSDRDEWDGLKADASETSIARLKAEWQAEVLEEMAQRLRDDPAGHPLFKVEYWANKYRRQATGGE